MPATAPAIEGTSRLREWRQTAGYTLEEVGALAGISTAMLSRAERGERVLSPGAKVRLSRSLGVALRELFAVELADA